MPTQLCILHANCQADEIRPLLENNPSFSKFFHIRQYTNYTNQQIANNDLTNCKLFLHQYLAPKWGNISTQEILKQLPNDCIIIKIPNFFFKGYWPFWTNKDQKIDFADSLLETLLSKNLSSNECLNLYIKANPNLFGDIEQIAEESLLYEEEKEKNSDIKYIHILRERWKHEQMFITINHPANTLLFHTANSLLKLLNIDQLSDTIQKQYKHPHDNFWLPIHPYLAKVFSLPFVTDTRRYKIFNTYLTHREYISAYLACREQNISSLLGFLENLDENSIKKLSK